jgi:hypothetical protein
MEAIGMNSDVTKRTLRDMDEFGIRYTRFLANFRDVGLVSIAGRVYLKLAAGRGTPGNNASYHVHSPGFSDIEPEEPPDRGDLDGRD